MLFVRILKIVSSIKYIGYYIAMVGLVIALIFSFFVYPKISTPYQVSLDPDFYGNLGYGVWKLGSLSYFPDTQPTVGRGPLYPVFIAFCLKVSKGWWPEAIQISQCILFAFTCFFVFWISKTLWGNRVAVLTSLICSFHPFVFWYTSRIWTESLIIFLFTLLIACILYLSLEPSKIRSVMLGFVLGLCVLTKQIFLPYILILPFFLIFMKHKKINRFLVIYICLTAVIVILPWTIRNWILTKKFIPVHARGANTVFIGDVVTEKYIKYPFSGAILFNEANKTIIKIGQTIPENWELYRKELVLDSKLHEKSINRYKKNPSFFLKKLILNAVMFWTLGQNNQKSLIISLMQIPLLILFIFVTIKIIRQKNILTLQGVNILFVWLYFFLHLPVLGAARYSVVLVPTMLTSLGAIMPKLCDN